MAEAVPLCLVGCGGMGHRHLMAYRVLEESGLANVELMAVCDVRPENAEFARREVERLFGRTPLVFTDLDQVLARNDILAVDVVTDGSTHHSVAIPALRAGKPIINGDRMALSTMMAVMGRTAAYTGKQITYEQALNAKEDRYPKDMNWETGKHTPPPLAKPGITPFV